MMSFPFVLTGPGKLLATVLIRAMGIGENHEILSYFGDDEIF